MKDNFKELEKRIKRKQFIIYTIFTIILFIAFFNWIFVICPIMIDKLNPLKAFLIEFPISFSLGGLSAYILWDWIKYKTKSKYGVEL